jgi:hypothetical protein
MKNRIEIPVEEPGRGRRGRRQRDDDAPKAEDQKPRKWKERDGYFQGAKVSRR